MEKERIYYWDNMKMVLIFLVVLGHFLIPVSQEGKSIQTVYYFIYLFHMPAFVFVSGYFAKYYMKKEVPNISKLIGFLIIFLVYKGLIWTVKSLLIGKVANFYFFSEDAAPWYLLAMFFWYMYLPLFSRFKPIVSVTFVVILGIFVGLDSSVGTFLCFSKSIVFFAFFLMGYYFKEDTIEKITSTKVKLVSVLLLSMGVIVVFFNLDFISRYEPIIYANTAYKYLSVSGIYGMFLRTIWYLIGFIMIFAFMSIVPKRKLVITYIGSRTLGIYIVHRLIRQVFSHYDVYRYFSMSGISLLLFCIVVSVAIVFLLSGKRLNRLCQLPFKIKYNKFFNKQ